MLLSMKFSYLKCKLFQRLNTLDIMMTKYEQLWNTLMSHNIFVWKFYWILYFHLVDKPNRNQPELLIFCYKYLMFPKITSSVKKTQIFGKLLTVLLLLMLLVLEVAVCKCSAKQVCLSFCFNEVAGRFQDWNFIKKEIPAQMFSCQFCKVSL